MSIEAVPKIIHYCWFGNKEMDKQSKEFIQEWKQKLPEYEFMLWTEENSDLNSNKFVRKAYNNKQWSFVSDFIRMSVLYEYGGVYLDTDVQLVKQFDNELMNSSFLGFETNECLGTGTIGVGPKNKIIEKMLNYYSSEDAYDKDGNIKKIPNTHILTTIAEKEGLKLNGKKQILNDTIKIYPIEYFSAKDSISRNIIQTCNTYCIHHYNGSWFDETQNSKSRRFIKNMFMGILGRERYFKIRYKISANLKK